MKRRGKIVVIIGVIVLVVGAASVAGYYFYSNQNTQTDTTQAPSENPLDLPNVAEVMQIANTDPAAAQETLDVALEKQTTPEGKSQVYSMKASVAASGSGGTSYTEALEYAQQADTTTATPSTAANIGFYYRQLGQTDEAITWYETALTRYGDRAELEPMQEVDYVYYEVVIEELKGEA